MLATEVLTEKSHDERAPEVLRPQGKTRNRVQLDYSAEEYQAFEQLARQSGAASVSDFVRRAVAVYRWMINEQNNGNKILVGDGNTATAVKFLFPK